MRRVALGAAVLVGAAMLAAPSYGATVPGAPTACTATATDASDVALSWSAPASNGGAALKWYAYQRQGDTGTSHTADASTTSATWSGSYSTSDVFRVRAVNSVGFSAWDTCSWGTTPPPPPPSRPLLPYSSNAWLRQTIGQLGLTQNASKTTAMRTYITAHDPHANPNLQGLGGNAWGDSWGGVATCSDPVFKIGTGTVNADNAFLKTTGFHASRNMADDITAAKANGGTDLPFEVIDTCGNSTFPNGFVVHGTQATVSGSTINVGGYAGAFALDSNGLDQRATGSNGPSNWSSRGVIPASATIRADQLKYAIDNNADLGQRLEIFWWETDSSAGMVSPPMAGFESGQAGWGAEGQVIGVNPTFTPTQSCDPGAAAIIRTLQTYGAYIGDNAGAGGTSLKVEQSHGQWAFDPGLSQRAFDSCGLSWSDFVAY